MKFRKKPVVIEAWQIPPNPPLGGTVPEWVLEATVDCALIWRVEGGVRVRTLEGEMLGNVGDWIIQGVEGEVYPCKRSIFEATYDPA